MTLKSIKETANCLGVAEATLANWRVSGKGPSYVKIGGKVCYRDEDVDAFIASSIRKSTSETEAA